MCNCDTSNLGDTGKFIALRYPHLDKQWLDSVNNGIAEFKKQNGGDVEMHVRWNKGRAKWTDWIIRIFSPSDK
jgi:hypothetical protein